MLVIPCPYCGEREETEFSYGNEAHIERPKDSDALDDAAWADYVFMQSNVKGAARPPSSPEFPLSPVVWVSSNPCQAFSTVGYQF